MKVSKNKIRFDLSQILTIEDFLAHINKENNCRFKEAHFSKLLSGEVELFLYLDDDSCEYEFKRFESKDYMIGYFRATLDSRFGNMFNFSKGAN